MSFYCCSPQMVENSYLLMKALKDSHLLPRHILIWNKNSPVLCRCDYNYKHEPIFYGWKEKGKHIFYGNGTMKTSVWDVNKPLKSDYHPTMKPLELIENAILNSSKENDLIIDFFGGSGSTLLACEIENRRCNMMELDPHYCDVIIYRWEKLTGKKAIKKEE